MLSRLLNIGIVVVGVLSVAASYQVIGQRQGMHVRVSWLIGMGGAALLAGDSRRLMEVVQQGVASPEHARLLKRLQAEWRRRSPK